MDRRLHGSIIGCTTALGYRVSRLARIMQSRLEALLAGMGSAG
jgi:hypothetical protein